MCDVCSDLLELLNSYQKQTKNESEKFPEVTEADVAVLSQYLHIWVTRQCMCCYRDSQNLERFSLLTQGIVYTCVQQLKALANSNAKKTDDEPKKPDDDSTGVKDVAKVNDASDQSAQSDQTTDQKPFETAAEKEKLFHLAAKIFLMNFPLYVAYKHMVLQNRQEDITTNELNFVGTYCELNDQEVPFILLKNVALFCKLDGLQAMIECFQNLTPDVLPVLVAHSVIAIVCNLKLWINCKTILQYIVPLRSKVLKYMCILADNELKTQQIKTMVDNIWTVFRDPLDLPRGLDSDGLNLSFKYFTSSTLTMRLSGITQINNYISLLADLCGTNSGGIHNHDISISSEDLEAAPATMADWLINNNIICHIFGPNLHVEVIKQSHIILNFLAMEGRITNEHLDTIWAAAQLKHCSKPVHELLPNLIKHLPTGPILHFYSLLSKLEPKDHTEQTLYLATVLIKIIWTRAVTMNTDEMIVQKLTGGKNGLAIGHKCGSSSENSISIDASNSDDEPGEDSCESPSESHKSVSEDEEEDEEAEEEEEEEEGLIDSEGPTPCKQARKRVSSNESQSSTFATENDEKCLKMLEKSAYIYNKIKIDSPIKKQLGISAHEIAHLATSTSEEEDEDEDIELEDMDEEMIRPYDAAHIHHTKGLRKKLNGEFNDSEYDSELEDVKLKELVCRTGKQTGFLAPEVEKLICDVHEDSSSGTDDEKYLAECEGLIPGEYDKQKMLGYLSGDDLDDSYSSRMSNRSEKNLADFDGEDSDGCEEELVKLAARKIRSREKNNKEEARLNVSPVNPTVDAKLFSVFKIEKVCEPGNTLLWDLLQENKIGQLGEGLASEAEKGLCNLLCFCDRTIRIKFIEGCLNNLANNTSVVISLRVLPKLLTSFQQFRTTDMHHITKWADQVHKMMQHFFNNLLYYTNMCKNRKNAMYTHQTEVQVRLHFLSTIYSPLSSPSSFKLSVDQVDILWNCLAYDPECNEELFSWLLLQVRNTEQHALGAETLKRLYATHLPAMPPENLNPTCLALFHQLLNVARHTPSFSKHGEVTGIDYLWKVALCARNTDVSMAAIQNLNNYYLTQRLQNENDFVSKCMTNLNNPSSVIGKKNATDSVVEAALLRIQRALLLLKTHLETFRRKYSYHLRKWTINGNGIVPHSSEGKTSTIRIHFQLSAITAERTTVEMALTDCVGDLRAEAMAIWKQICLKIERNAAGAASHNDTTFQQAAMLGNFLNDGPIRMLTQGQELTTDIDEKTLQEINFKENQVVYISLGLGRSSARGKKDANEFSQAPPRECAPMMLLLKPEFFEQLFNLMHALSAMRMQGKNGEMVLHAKAQVLSRRVWDILAMLPTSPTLLKGFQNQSQPLTELLNPSSTQKLIYALQIVEAFSLKKHLPADENNWTSMFILKGGLRHLFDIFMSGVLQENVENDEGSEWQQDCLSILLKLINQLGVNVDDIPPTAKFKSEKLQIPTLNKFMLSLMDTKNTMSRIMSILCEISLPIDVNHYRTGFCGRSQVIFYTMNLLVSWLHGSDDARQSFMHAPNLEKCLERLIIDEADSSVRKEVCMSIYRLCLGSTVQNKHACLHLITFLLNHLLVFIEKAERMKPKSDESRSYYEEGKEPYPACRDYFWLICRLVDGLNQLDDIDDVDLNKLCKQISELLYKRPFYEERHNTVEDEGLKGLLSLLGGLIKYQPEFQNSDEGERLLNEVFDCLFALPSPKQRHFPKAKSTASRSAAYDLLVELAKGSPKNYGILRDKLLLQHKPGQFAPYPWDYWPHDDGRSECGYVGLTNLGATCYMASCIQHLYMMPQTRTSILAADFSNSKHEAMLKELQRMFAYLLESERKAYNPRGFCKVYQMDHQPLNTGEQKDMAEFFIDLVSKLEEMTPDLKKVIKTLFCGTLSNNVVSLDCEHVSRTLEEFYTVRCQVADMRNLYESLDEVTVKDTLEGDNMYTCSQCGKKVRAEKRACFKKLPQILCFNTMRYTFNMITMLKEKVNTHFSFPLRLNMAGYVEKQLMSQQYAEEKEKMKNEKQDGAVVDVEPEHYEYDLIGVTVHTGTADGGHYYSFIKDRSCAAQDKWLLFNDAEVKPFNPDQLAAECFGGEMTSKTYDSTTEKFMDFSFEKTNSAYMLFYEYCNKDSGGSNDERLAETSNSNNSNDNQTDEVRVTTPSIQLSADLEEWIWKDNMNFIRDKNIFEHAYFNFMWQICGYIPQTLLPHQPDVKLTTLAAAELSTTFLIETFIHAKEKPTMVQWVELVTKHFIACSEACEWFLDYMADDSWWLIQVLIKCPNQMIRQMFQRLCIHVIQQLRGKHSALYLLLDDDQDVGDDAVIEDVKPDEIGNKSCVTKFVKSLLRLMEHGAKAHLKHLTEYFVLLYDFSRMGEEETKFLVYVRAISTMVNFYLGHKIHDFIDVSDNDEEDEMNIPADKYKPASLDKMIALIATLVEKSRGTDNRLRLSTQDYNSLAGGGKGFPFLYQQIKDNINLAQTRNLIHSLCRENERLALQLVTMISQAITRHQDTCQPFFKLLTLLTEGASVAAGSSSAAPCFTQLVLQRVWDAAESCPHSVLEWLSMQVPRNKFVHQWVLQSIDVWLENFLIAHGNTRVRSAAASLLVSLVPSVNFRQCFRARGMHNEPMLNTEAQNILHTIYTSLLRLLKVAGHYIDPAAHGTAKLTAYFALLTYCVVSKTEKLMFSPYLPQLWALFHPKLSEPSIPSHHNKQALLVFWHHVSLDCPENIQLILDNSYIQKHIAFNYILADHDDQEIVLFNRGMLPAYYGLLRLCCQQSRLFTRFLASHQNIQWAFKNITPHHNNYTAAVDELFKMMQLFVKKCPDASESEMREIEQFRRNTLSAYLQSLDGRNSWATLITAFRILIETDEDRLYVVCNGGLQLTFESFLTLHMMYHEPNNCNISSELTELLSLCLELVKSFSHAQHMRSDISYAKAVLLSCKDFVDTLRKLATLLNTYNSTDIRLICLDLLKELVLIAPEESLHHLAPLLHHCHQAYQIQDRDQIAVPYGPYFPRRTLAAPAKNARPLRPMVQMAVPQNLDCPRGTDPLYDKLLSDFYAPYHEFIDILCRVAVNKDCFNEAMITLSAMVAFEAATLHSTFFASFWLNVFKSNTAADRKYITTLMECTSFIDYVDAIMLDERASLSIDVIYEFMLAFFPKIATNVINEQTYSTIEKISLLIETVPSGTSFNLDKDSGRLLGDLRALFLVYNTIPNLLTAHAARLVAPLQNILDKIKTELDDEVLETPMKKRKITNEDSPSTSQTPVTTKPATDSTDVDKNEENTEGAVGEEKANKTCKSKGKQENAKEEANFNDDNDSNKILSKNESPCSSKGPVDTKTSILVNLHTIVKELLQLIEKCENI